MTQPAQITLIRDTDNPWFEVVLTEGKNREIRKMFEEVGHFVEKVRRVGFGPLVLDVPPGETRELNEEEVTQLKRAARKKGAEQPRKQLRARPRSGPSTLPRAARKRVLGRGPAARRPRPLFPYRMKTAGAESAYDVVVVGAGAAGLFCAIHAGRGGRRVLVLDHANRIGKKILISGGGRCNFTNLHTTAGNFLSANPHFAKSALARYTPADFLALVEQHQIPWHEKTLGQLFCDRAASEIVSMLEQECAAAEVTVLLSTRVREVAQNDGFRLETDGGVFSGRSLVIATGGLSIPKLGATAFGYQIAQQFGLRVQPCRPALVPLTFFLKILRGMRI